MSSPEKKEWEREFYKGRENDLLVPAIVERLVSLGYLVERVSVKHNTGGYGSTKGIGDLLVSRSSYQTALGFPGMKINAEVKTSEEAAVSKEQEIGLGMGTLVKWTTPDEAEEFMRKVDCFICTFFGYPVGELLNTVGSEGYRAFLPARVQTKRRTSKWLREAREAAKSSGGSG